jgi:hypothetical protein
MILTIGSNDYEIDVNNDFNPLYSPAITSQALANGNYFFADRGAEFDRRSVSFDIVGEIADINDIVSVLKDHKGNVSIDTNGLHLFGSGLDYSSAIECNYTISNYNIEDIRTSEIKVTLSAVNDIPFLISVPSTQPKFIYSMPFERNVKQVKNNFQSMQLGGERGASILVNSVDSVLSENVVKLNTTLFHSEFANLFKFIYTNRATPFTVNTTFKLFFNSLSNSVILTNFTFKPSGAKLWEVSFNLVKNG